MLDQAIKALKYANCLEFCSVHVPEMTDSDRSRDTSPAESAEPPSVEYFPPGFPPGYRGYAGALETFTPAIGIDGWALDLSHIGQRLEVQLKCEGILLTRTVTHRPRPDLDGVLGQTTLAGFHFGWGDFDLIQLQSFHSEGSESFVTAHVAFENKPFRCLFDRLTVADITASISLNQETLRRSSGSDYIEISDAGLFDFAWYSATYAAAMEFGEDALLHFLSNGESIGYKPNFYFDPGYYANKRGLPGPNGALLDYCRSSDRLEISPSPHFDLEWYRTTHKLSSDTRAFVHFWRNRTIYSPNSKFDAQRYIDLLRDHLGAAEPKPEDAYAHYILVGRDLGIPAERPSAQEANAYSSPQISTMPESIEDQADLAASSTQYETVVSYESYYDRKLYGWAGRQGGKETEADQLSLRLVLEGVDLGRVARTMYRTDVNAHLDYDTVKTGFTVSAAPVLCFAELFGGSTPSLTGVMADDLDRRLVPFPAMKAGSPPSLLPLENLAESEIVKLVDLWLTNPMELRLRLQINPENSALVSTCVLSLYQMTVRSPSRLRSLGQYAIDGEVNFASFSLYSAYLPILLVLTDSTGAVQITDILPFPSLCRGGRHYPELRAAGLLDNDFSNLQALSRTLLDAWLDGRNGESRVGPVIVETSGANGNELIFAPDASEWISGLMGVPIRLGEFAKDDEERATDHLTAVLAEREAVYADRTTLAALAIPLLLPADAIPTIAALTRQVRAHEIDLIRACSYIVSPLALAGKAWTIAMPYIRTGATLLSSDRGMSCPVLSKTVHLPDRLIELDAHRPMAIRYPYPGSADPVDVLYPTDPSYQKYTNDLAGTYGRISVCVAFTSFTTSVIMLLEAISTQTVADDVDIVIAIPDSRTPLAAGLTRHLETFYPNRHRILAVPVGDNIAALLNAAAERAEGDYLLFVASDVIPFDARTLSTLRFLAATPTVASAACMLLKPAPKGFDPACSGYFLTGFSTTVPPAISYEPLDCSEALPDDTYPVAANSASIMMTSRSAFLSLGGFDAKTFRAGGWEIDFGLRAIQGGFINLTTTRLRAYIGSPPGRRHFDIDAQYRFPDMNWQKLASSTTSLRRVL